MPFPAFLLNALPSLLGAGLGAGRAAVTGGNPLGGALGGAIGGGVAGLGQNGFANALKAGAAGGIGGPLGGLGYRGFQQQQLGQQDMQDYLNSQIQPLGPRWDDKPDPKIVPLSGGNFVPPQFDPMAQRPKPNPRFTYGKDGFGMDFSLQDLDSLLSSFNPFYNSGVMR